MYRFLILFLCSILITACGASSQVVATQTANTPIVAARTKTPTATDVMPTFQAATATKEPTIEPTATETDTPTATATATLRPATRTPGPSVTPQPTRTPLPTRTPRPTPIPTEAVQQGAGGLTEAEKAEMACGEYNVRDLPAQVGGGTYTGEITAKAGDKNGGWITVTHTDAAGNQVVTSFAYGPAHHIPSGDIILIRVGDHGVELGLSDRDTWWVRNSYGKITQYDWYRTTNEEDFTLGTKAYVYTLKRGDGSLWAQEVEALERCPVK